MEKISVIKDSNLGYKARKIKKPKIRLAARGIIFREDGKIVVFCKKKKNEYKLPGGGIEKNESPFECFIREAKEETGCDIEIIEELGTIDEIRSHDNFLQTSYVFIGKVLKDNKRLFLTNKEQDEGGSILWLTPEEAYQKVLDSMDKLIPSKYENLYHSKFIVYRDQQIIKYYLNHRGSWNNLYQDYIHQEYQNFEKYYQIKMKLKKKFINLVMKYGKDKPILECGCGLGKTSVYLASKNLKTYGIDLEKKMIDDARALSKKICPNNLSKFIVGDIKKIPYPDKYFSVCHSSGVLEHFSDTEIINIINEELRVADYIVFSVPTKYFDKKMLGNERFMTRNEWKKIIYKSKAKIIKMTGYHYKTLKKRIIDILKNPKKIFKPIALYVFVLKEKEK